MINGILPNNTIWWLSTDGLKIWIESKDLEFEKFEQKGYRVKYDSIFYANKDVGELTTSRLESKTGKDAWMIKLQAILDVYPELIEEIERKKFEEKKKKKTIRKDVTPKTSKIVVRSVKKESAEPKSVGAYFDINRPYVAWIKDEVDKNGKLTISFEKLKEKMGIEFLNMHDIRIYLGLKKILPNIGITIESKNEKWKSFAIMQKI